MAFAKSYGQLIWIGLAGSTILLFGCGIERAKDDLSIRVPGTWAAAGKGNEGQISTGWLDGFSDSGLRTSVNEALAHNQSLKAVAARLDEARQEGIFVRAQRLPSLDLGVRGSAIDAQSGGARESYGLNLAASWEPDLWGRLRNLTKAAEADVRAAMEDFRGARLSLAANAAKVYVDLVAADQEVDLAQFTLDSFEKNLRVIERNYKATGEGALDIKFARTNVSSAQRVLESRKLERENTARTLEVLVGRYPSGQVRGGREFPVVTASIPVGIPAGLIERRPDLAAARARLLASAERADAARKNLLPNLSLTAGGATTGARFSDLLKTDFLVSTITGNVEQFLYDGGARGAAARGALARNERLVHEYAQLALVAFREVEVTLAAERSLAAQEKFLENEVSQAVLAEKQAEREYAEGVNLNILSVLEAQRRANNARAAMIRLKNQRLQNRLDLHLALGGDFRTEV